MNEWTNDIATAAPDGAAMRRHRNERAAASECLIQRTNKRAALAAQSRGSAGYPTRFQPGHGSDRMQKTDQPMHEDPGSLTGMHGALSLRRCDSADCDWLTADCDRSAGRCTRSTRRADSGW